MSMSLFRLLCPYPRRCCAARVPALAAVALFAVSVAACGGNPGGPVDSGTADAARPDAARPDATGIDAAPDAKSCFTYQIGVLGWKTMLGVFNATVTEVGNPSNQTTAAPNGRAILCIPLDTDSTVEIAHPKLDQTNNIPAYITRLNQVDIKAAMIRAKYTPAARGRLITPSDADMLYTNQLQLTRVPAKAIVLIDVRSFPTNAGLTGASVSLGSTANDGAFTEGASGTYAAGNSVGGTSSEVLFANVDASAGSVPVTVTPPAGFSGSCEGPTSIPVAAGELSYTLFACQP